MSELCNQLREAAAGLAVRGGAPPEMLLRQAADQLEAADIEALWMYERIRALVRALDRRARLEFGQSQAGFMTKFPQADPEGYEAWRRGRELLLHVEGYALTLREELEGKGTPSQVFRSDWIATFLAAGAWAMREQAAE